MHGRMVGNTHGIISGKITFSLQQSGKYKPFKTVIAKKLYLPKRFFDYKSFSIGKIKQEQIFYDYALLELSEDIGNIYGWNDIKSVGNVFGEKINVSSYPRDKGNLLTYQKCLTNSFNSGIKNSEFRNKDFLGFNCDIQKGSSGSGLFNKYNEVIGVTSAIIEKSFNRAFKITKENEIIIRNVINGFINKREIIVTELSSNNNYQLIFQNLCEDEISIALKIKDKNGFYIDGFHFLNSKEKLIVDNVIDKNYYFYGKISRNLRKNGEWKGKYNIKVNRYNEYPFIKSNIKTDAITAIHIQSFDCD